MRRKVATSESLKEKNPHPYVVDKSEIHDLVASLSIRDLGTIAGRFQRVADLTTTAFEVGRDHLEAAELTLIKRIASEGNRKNYQRIMSAIIAGVGQGLQGINAAHLTANLVVQLTFRWSLEYRIALDSYRHRLGQRDHTSPRAQAGDPSRARSKRSFLL